MSASPYGIGATDFQKGINFDRMREERLARTQAALKRHNIPTALLVRHENIRYTLAVRGHAFAPQLSYALVFAEHDPILYDLGDQLGQQKVYCPWIKPDNLRFSYCWLDSIGGKDAAQAEAKKFADAIVSDLKKHGLTAENLGVDALDERGREALIAQGVKLVDAKPALMDARKCKTSDEIACIETAVSIANAGYMSFLSFKAGMRERDGGAAMYDAMMRAGAEVVSGGVRAKMNTYDVYHFGNTDQIVDPGDLVQVNTCGTIYAGYKVCIYRSFIVGRRPNTKERDWYKRCYERVYGVTARKDLGLFGGAAARGCRGGSRHRHDLRGTSDQPPLVVRPPAGAGARHDCCSGMPRRRMGIWRRSPRGDGAGYRARPSGSQQLARGGNRTGRPHRMTTDVQMQPTFRGDPS
jgi:Xaa-Pro aminopeptidase